MNWETILVAAITGLSSALITLVPVYVKMRNDKETEAENSRLRKIQLENDAKKLEADINSTVQQAAREIIKSLNERIDGLEEDLKEERKARKLLEAEIEEERAKRRIAERKVDEQQRQLEAAQAEIILLKNKITVLEKRDTGELKAK